MSHRTNIKAGMVVTALLFLLFSCHHASQSPEEIIPEAPVQMKIDLNHEGHELLEPLSYKVYKVPQLYGELIGHCGLVIVHSISLEQPYSAYDLICPYDYPEKVAIEVIKDESLLSAECPKCHTIYDLSLGLGNPTKGIGKTPLLQYRINKQGNMLYIHN